VLKSRKQKAFQLRQEAQSGSTIPLVPDAIGPKALKQH
jgi:hypothetical protein